MSIWCVTPDAHTSFCIWIFTCFMLQPCSIHISRALKWSKHIKNTMFSPDVPHMFAAFNRWKHHVFPRHIKAPQPCPDSPRCRFQGDGPRSAAKKREKSPRNRGVIETKSSINSALEWEMVELYGAILLIITIVELGDAIIKHLWLYLDTWILILMTLWRRCIMFTCLDPCLVPRKSARQVPCHNVYTTHVNSIKHSCISLIITQMLHGAGIFTYIYPQNYSVM